MTRGHTVGCKEEGNPEFRNPEWLVVMDRKHVCSFLQGEAHRPSTAVHYIHMHGKIV